MGLHFFEIEQGFFAVLMLGLAAAALLLAVTAARVAFFQVRQRMSRPAKPSAPVKLRLVRNEPKPAPQAEPDDDADWLKDFG